MKDRQRSSSAEPNLPTFFTNQRRQRSICSKQITVELSEIGYISMVNLIISHDTIKHNLPGNGAGKIYKSISKPNMF